MLPWGRPDVRVATLGEASVEALGRHPERLAQQGAQVQGGAGGGVRTSTCH